MANALNAGRLLRSRLATLRPLGMAFGLVLVVLLFLKQQSMAQLFAQWIGLVSQFCKTCR